MVDRFTSAPLELPTAEHDFERADLIFYGLDHSGSSYEAQVFMAARGVGGKADQSHRAYVGSFFILGHGGCFGDVGHCDIPTARDPFDLRPAHQLEPAVRIVTVTEPLRAMLQQGLTAAKVTVAAYTEGRASNDVLSFRTIRLATYA
jgi:tyrosinase